MLTEQKPEDKVEPKPETKPDPTKSALNQDSTKPEPALGAPEKYTDFKLPDGLTLDTKSLDEATAVFKGLNLSQDAAQSLVDFHAKQLKSAIDSPYTAVATLKTDWESKLTSTYGKDIQPGGKVLTSISRMIDTLPPTMASDLREALDLTLGGSNPAIVAALYEISKRQSEGTTVKGNNPSPLGQKGPDAAPKSIANALYPHLKSASDAT